MEEKEEDELADDYRVSFAPPQHNVQRHRSAADFIAQYHEDFLQRRKFSSFYERLDRYFYPTSYFRPPASTDVVRRHPTLQNNRVSGSDVQTNMRFDMAQFLPVSDLAKLSITSTTNRPLQDSEG